MSLSSVCPQRRRPNAHPSAIRSSDPRITIVKRVIHTDLPAVGAFETFQASTKLVLHTDTCLITRKPAARLIRVVNASIAEGADVYA